jgi:large subunit ribosomal protein L20
MPSFSKKKYFRLAKGFYGRAKNCLKLSIMKVEKSLLYAYKARKMRPRKFRE